MEKEIKSPLQPSGLTLTKEQQESYLKEKREKFLKDFQEIEKKHEMTFAAYLDITPGGLMPRLTILPITKNANV